VNFKHDSTDARIEGRVRDFDSDDRIAHTGMMRKRRLTMTNDQHITLRHRLIQIVCKLDQIHFCTSFLPSRLDGMSKRVLSFDFIIARPREAFSQQN
jgi:hypothetical protein